MVWVLLIVLGTTVAPVAAVVPTEAACLEAAESHLQRLAKAAQPVLEVSCTQHRLPRLRNATGELL